jgi:hypothetical protein
MALDTIFDYNKHLTQFSIIVSLAVRVVDRKEFAAMCIRNGIEKNVPNKEILQSVKDMIQDNEPVMVGILGKELNDKIKNLDI